MNIKQYINEIIFVTIIILIGLISFFVEDNCALCIG